MASQKARDMYRKIQIRQAQDASDGYKKVKQGRKSPIGRGIILDASTPTLQALLDKPLPPDQRQSIELELKSRGVDV